MIDLLYALTPVDHVFAACTADELAQLKTLHDLIAADDALYASVEGAWYLTQMLDAELRGRYFRTIPQEQPSVDSGRGWYVTMHQAAGDSVYAHAQEHGRPYAYTGD
jgi:hypothetical protein